MAHSITARQFAAKLAPVIRGKLLPDSNCTACIELAGIRARIYVSDGYGVKLGMAHLSLHPDKRKLHGHGLPSINVTMGRPLYVLAKDIKRRLIEPGLARLREIYQTAADQENTRQRRAESRQMLADALGQEARQYYGTHAHFSGLEIAYEYECDYQASDIHAKVRCSWPALLQICQIIRADQELQRKSSQANV